MPKIMPRSSSSAPHAAPRPAPGLAPGRAEPRRNHRSAAGRRRARLLPAMALLVACGAAPALAQRDFSQVEMKATHVGGKVWMLEGSGGNIGVSVGDDGILIVDDQFAPLADKIRASLKDLGEGKLRFILNTHWHGDHTGGNAVFGPEATIIAHDNVRQRLSTRQNASFGVVEASPAEALPVITFQHGLSVHFNNEEIKVVHFPRGHTDGDSVVFFTGSNVVHMGDDLFSGRFPFVDLKSGGSVAGLIEAVEKVLGILPEGAKLIAGHGPLSDAAGLRQYLEMLRETRSVVREGIRAGKSLEEIKEKGLPEKWKDWSGQFIDTGRWIQILHDDLTAEGE